MGQRNSSWAVREERDRIYCSDMTEETACVWAILEVEFGELDRSYTAEPRAQELSLPVLGMSTMSSILSRMSSLVAWIENSGTTSPPSLVLRPRYYVAPRTSPPQ